MAPKIPPQIKITPTSKPSSSRFLRTPARSQVLRSRSPRLHKTTFWSRKCSYLPLKIKRSKQWITLQVRINNRCYLCNNKSESRSKQRQTMMCTLSRGLIRSRFLSLNNSTKSSRGTSLLMATVSLAPRTRYLRLEASLPRNSSSHRLARRNTILC